MQTIHTFRPLPLIAAGLLGLGLSGVAYAEASKGVGQATFRQTNANSAAIDSMTGTVPQGSDPFDTDAGAGLGLTMSRSGPITSTASTTGTAEFGVLKATAQAHVESTAANTATNNNVAGDATGTVQLVSNDSITITSDSLAAGTAVTVNFVVSLDSTIDFDGQGGFGSAAALFAINDGTGLNQIAAFNAFPEGANNGTQTGSLAYATTVGAVIDFNFNLTAFASAQYQQDGNGEMSSMIDVQAGNTALLGIVTGPGFSFIADSGASYTAPVPEPETYAMLLAGLGLVGFAARRRLNA